MYDKLKKYILMNKIRWLPFYFYE